MSGGSSQQTAQLDPALRDAYLQNVETSRGVAGELAPRQFARYNEDQARAVQQTRDFANPNNAIFQGMGDTFDVANSKLGITGQVVLGNIDTTPTATANSAALYNATEGSGGTGVYVRSTTVDDELCSKTKAIVFGIIF